MGAEQPAAPAPAAAPPGSAPPAPAPRLPLPVDARSLPPAGATFDAVLDHCLQDLDLDLTPGMRAALEAQVRLLLAWSPFVNLTAIRDPAEIAREHVGDSLAAVPLLLDLLAARRPPRPPVGLLDVGSGAGYPGLPVALAIPVRRALLVDSVGRKTAFLEVAAAAARAAFEAHGEEPVPVRVTQARAEALAGDPGHRDRWEIVTARAVANLATLVRAALPLVRPGGYLVAWKRDAGDGAFGAELDAALEPMQMLGADPQPEVSRVTVAGLSDHRLVLIRKKRPTPRPPARAGRRVRRQRGFRPPHRLLP